MHSKPVIILGGGLWGNLLAYRLSQALPQLQFKLYSTSSVTENTSWSFRESELSEEARKWVAPFVSYQWRGYQLHSQSLNRTVNQAFATILPGQLELNLRKTITVEKLGPEVSMEELLERASFVIDTRPDPLQKTKCTRLTLGLVVELSQEHHLSSPIAIDANVKQEGVFRHLQYLPLNSHTLLVKDVRYVKDSHFDLGAREEELLWEVRKRWKIKDVLHRESETVAIPSGRLRQWSWGRVISLSGLLNPVNGDQFAEAVRVVDLMVATSFRLGELKEVLGRYRSQKDSAKGLSRLVVKMLYHSPHPQHRLQLLEYLLKLPSPLVEKFLDGKLRLLDLARSFLGNPPFPLLRALTSVLPEFQFKLPNLSTKH